MTQLGTTPSGPRRKASNNIYTVLALIALVALIVGIIFVWVRSFQLFGAGHPFEKVKSSRIELVAPTVESTLV